MFNFNSLRQIKFKAVLFTKLKIAFIILWFTLTRFACFAATNKTGFVTELSLCAIDLLTEPGKIQRLSSKLLQFLFKFSFVRFYFKNK